MKVTTHPLTPCAVVSRHMRLTPPHYLFRLCFEENLTDNAFFSSFGFPRTRLPVSSRLRSSDRACSALRFLSPAQTPARFPEARLFAVPTANSCQFPLQFDLALRSAPPDPPCPVRPRISSVNWHSNHHPPTRAHARTPHTRMGVAATTYPDGCGRQLCCVIL